jgi:hypothetical protein
LTVGKGGVGGLEDEDDDGEGGMSLGEEGVCIGAESEGSTETASTFVEGGEDTDVKGVVRRGGGELEEPESILISGERSGIFRSGFSTSGGEGVDVAIILIASSSLSATS